MIKKPLLNYSFENVNGIKFINEKKVIKSIQKLKDGWCQGGHNGKCLNCNEKIGYFMNDNNKWICFDCWIKEVIGDGFE